MRKETQWEREEQRLRQRCVHWFWRTAGSQRTRVQVKRKRLRMSVWTQELDHKEHLPCWALVYVYTELKKPLCDSSGSVIWSDEIFKGSICCRLENKPLRKGAGQKISADPHWVMTLDWPRALAVQVVGSGSIGNLFQRRGSRICWRTRGGVWEKGQSSIAARFGATYWMHGEHMGRRIC